MHRWYVTRDLILVPLDDSVFEDKCSLFGLELVMLTDRVIQWLKKNHTSDSAGVVAFRERVKSIRDGSDGVLPHYSGRPQPVEEGAAAEVYAVRHLFET